MIIYDITEKGKDWFFHHLSKLFVPILIIGVGCGTFGIGEIVHIRKTHVPVSIEYATSTASSELKPENQNFPVSEIAPKSAQQKAQSGVQLPKPVTTQTPKLNVLKVQSSGMYVAAKTGKAYYLPWCASVKRIAEKNKVWFSSKEAAERSGYVPAGNCKGMK